MHLICLDITDWLLTLPIFETQNLDPLVKLVHGQCSSFCQFPRQEAQAVGAKKTWQDIYILRRLPAFPAVQCTLIWKVPSRQIMTPGFKLNSSILVNVFQDDTPPIYVTCTIEIHWHLWWPNIEKIVHHPFSAQGLESQSILVFLATSWLAWSNRLAATWAAAEWCELRNTKAEKFESYWILLTQISFPNSSWKSLGTPATLVRC